MKALFLTALLLTTTATAWAKEPAPVKAAAPAAVVQAKPAVARSADPQKFVAGLYERLNALALKSITLTALHKEIGTELQDVIDYGEMAKLTLGHKWTEINDAQRKQFTELLSKMVLNTYVKRFKPGTAVEIAWNGVRTPGAGKAVVQTTIRVKKTSADVEYAMLSQPSGWMVYDIVVDDASQVQTYRQSFKKVMDKEGWDGLIKRMQKAADKRVE